MFSVRPPTRSQGAKTALSPRQRTRQHYTFIRMSKKPTDPAHAFAAALLLISHQRQGPLFSRTGSASVASAGAVSSRAGIWPPRHGSIRSSGGKNGEQPGTNCPKNARFAHEMPPARFSAGDLHLCAEKLAAVAGAEPGPTGVAPSITLTVFLLVLTGIRAGGWIENRGSHGEPLLC